MDFKTSVENDVPEILLSMEASIDNNNNKLILESVTKTFVEKASTECLQAQEAINSDPWDISSWMIYLEEVENGRSGSIEKIEAFKSFLEKFPRSSKFWRKLSELYSSLDSDKAEETLLIGCKICFDVDLWYSFIEGKINKSKQDKQEIDILFEISLDLVGTSIDSYQLWKLNIDYLLSIADESNRKDKYLQIYNLFQRAFVIPMENYDSLLKCFEDFDKICRKYFPESSDLMLFPPDKLKLQEIKEALKAKKRLISNIIFDRLAVPPTGSSNELQQVELWDQLISLELNNSFNLPDKHFFQSVRMLFQQCLNCFYRNPEIWIAFAQFEQDQSFSENAKNLLKQGIIACPLNNMLKIKLAELEEIENNIEEATLIYRQAFESNPSGYTFSLYQRFIRRHFGMLAARCLFSETSQLRLHSPEIALEFYIAHASIELEVNNQSKIALNILNCAKAKFPNAMKDYHFLNVYLSTLSIVGDLEQIRCITNFVLNDIINDQLSFTQFGRVIKIKTDLESGKLQNSLQKKIELITTFLSIEKKFGTFNIRELNKILSVRESIKLQLNEIIKKRVGSYIKKSIFEPSSNLFERYDNSFVDCLKYEDEIFRDRVLTKLKSNGPDPHFDSIFKLDNKNTSVDFHLSMSGLPISLRELLTKLPQNLGFLPDVDGFIRHMKSVVLPPRPSSNDTFEGQVEIEPLTSQTYLLNDLLENDDVFRKRQRNDL